MPFYHKLGTVPPKRHTQFRRPDGALYAEELVSLHGFSDISSLLYHYHAPTQVTRLVPLSSLHREAWEDGARHHHLRTGQLPAGGDAIDGRWTLLYNADLAIATLRPTQSMAYFYRNADGDEVYFVHAGEGRLAS